MTVDVDSKYLTFADLDDTDRKTAVVSVGSKSSGLKLGEIRFWPKWRQYVFHPEDHTLFNAGCLSDIITALAQLNGDHRDKITRARRARRVDPRAAR